VSGYQHGDNGGCFEHALSLKPETPESTPWLPKVPCMDAPLENDGFRHLLATA
jgi:hypothetical protein